MLNWISRMFRKKNVQTKPPIRYVHHLTEFSFFPPDSRNKHYEVVFRQAGLFPGMGLDLAGIGEHNGVWRILHMRPVESVKDMWTAIIEKELNYVAVSEDMVRTMIGERAKYEN